ncbi:Lon protease family protein, partial [Vibrio parahaemolyticus]|nr:Lon protease family protein [Vibrio parahaemolyticus]
MNQLNWQDVTPSLEQYEALLKSAPSLPKKSFTDLQPRMSATISRFSKISGLTRVLLINCVDNSVYREFISKALQSQSNAAIVLSESLDAKRLFDRYSVDLSGDIAFQPGLISQADSGYLIVPANLILANPGLWPNIKSAIQQNLIEPLNL